MWLLLKIDKKNIALNHLIINSFNAIAEHEIYDNNDYYWTRVHFTNDSNIECLKSKIKSLFNRLLDLKCFGLSLNLNDGWLECHRK